MMQAFDLFDYSDVSDNADAIVASVRSGQMPCDGAWPSSWVEVFERWTQSGMSK